MITAQFYEIGQKPLLAFEAILLQGRNLHCFNTFITYHLCNHTWVCFRKSLRNSLILCVRVCFQMFLILFKFWNLLPHWLVWGYHFLFIHVAEPNKSGMKKRRYRLPLSHRGIVYVGNKNHLSQIFGPAVVIRKLILAEQHSLFGSSKSIHLSLSSNTCKKTGYIHQDVIHSLQEDL